MRLPRPPWAVLRLRRCRGCGVRFAGQNVVTITYESGRREHYCNVCGFQRQPDAVAWLEGELERLHPTDVP